MNFKQWPILLSKVGSNAPGQQLAGAELQVEAPANLEYSGISGAPDFPKQLLLCEAVPYTVSEEAAPKGYKAAAAVKFRLDARGKIELLSGEAQVNNPAPPNVLPPVLTLVNQKTAVEKLCQITVDARRTVNKTSLAGVQIKYFDLSDPEFIMELTTSAAPTPVQILSGHIYHFKQESTLPGYNLWGPDSLECMVDENGDFQMRGNYADNHWRKQTKAELNFDNRKDWQVTLSKVAEDERDWEQSGAKLQFGWPGAPDYFIGYSGAQGFPQNFVMAEGIPYTYSELQAPAGYTLHEPIVFSLDEFGMIVVASGDAYVDPDTPLAAPAKMVMINKKAVSATSGTLPKLSTKPGGGQSTIAPTTTTRKTTPTVLTKKTTLPSTKKPLLAQASRTSTGSSTTSTAVATESSLTEAPKEAAESTGSRLPYYAVGAVLLSAGGGAPFLIKLLRKK